MWLETVSKPEDNEEKCPSCGGGVHRRVYGEMYAGSFISDGERVEVRRVPNEGFADPIYLDPLATYFDGGLYRRWPSDRYWSRSGKKLHRDVWEKAFGPIPDGCHIHHRDSNPDNNLLANLECIPASEHLSLSRNQREQPVEGWFTDEARNKAAAWHRSEEGRLWHRRHAKRAKSWTKWKREPRDCPQCGKEFQCLIRANGKSQKFCSDKCKSLSYRARRAAERSG